MHTDQGVVEQDKRVAVYMRVSTARQEEEQTVENQLMELKARVQADGYELTNECIYKDEGWSGAILQRPDLDRLRADARDHKFDILYSYDRGRVSRKFVHQEIILDDLRSCGVEYISLHDINGTSPEEMLMGNVMGLFHEYEKLKITERMRIGKIRKVRESKKLLGYNPKYGYDYHPRHRTDGTTVDGYFSINIQQASVVHQIFEWIANGNSKYSVRQMLFDQGTVPPKGRQAMWPASTIDRLLRDTTYYGQHYYNKTEAIPSKRLKQPELKYRKLVNGSRKVRPKDDWMLVEVPAIVDQQLFDKVQLQLATHRRLNPRNNKKNEYLLNGLVECPCGKARTGDPGNRTHLYYRCTDRLSKYPLPRTCNERGVNVSVLDEVVWKELSKLLSDPELIRQQAARWLEQPSQLAKRIDTTQAKLSSLDSEEKRYTKAYGSGLMSERLYKTEARDLMTKRKQLVSELSSLQFELSARPHVSADQLAAQTSKLVQGLGRIDRKFVVRKLVTKVVATQQEATIWGSIPVSVGTTNENKDNHQSIDNANDLLNQGKVGYESIDRYCWIAKCR